MIRYASLLRGSLVLLLALALAPHPVSAQEQVLDTTCREVRTLDAMEYWFWSAFSGLSEVHDIGQERLGRLTIDETVCFRIALVTLDNEQQKNAGIRQAVGELIMWTADDSGGNDMKRARDRLEDLTGEDFDTHVEWLEWWEARNDFVLWSDEQERLVVVESAMEAGEAVHDEAMVLSAEEYWFYAGRGWVLDSEPFGRFVLGTVLIPPHDFSFRIEADRLDDRAAKERGFRRALENLIVDGLLTPEVGDARVETIIEQLSILTDERYDDPAGWLSWWNANADRLVLSGSGDRLVVKR